MPIHPSPSFTSISTSSPPTSIPTNAPTSHSRTPSLSIPLPVYSSNRFKRRFKGILWSVVCIVCIAWVGIVRHRNATEQETIEETAVFRGDMGSAKVLLSTIPREEVEETKDEVVVGSRGEDEHETLAALPFCRKTFLFRFAGLHGQGSELNLLLRLSSLATYYNYTFLLESHSWNYGPFTSYFQPFPPTVPLQFPSNGAASLKCRPPAPTTKRIKVRLNEGDLERMGKDEEWVPDWARDGNHVVWGPQRDMDGLDQTIVKLFTNSSRLADLHDKDRLQVLDQEMGPGRRGKELGGLDEEETMLSLVFGDAFDRLSDEAKRVWKVNKEVRDMVEELEERLGLPLARVGGERKELKDLVVGVHVRLGDKYLETDRIGPQSSLSTDPVSANATTSPYSASYAATPGLLESTITKYFASAIKAINKILDFPASNNFPTATTTSTRQEQIEYLEKLSEGWGFEGQRGDEGKPTLILMSDDENAVEQFRKHPLAAKFRVVGTAAEKVPVEEVPVAEGDLEEENVEEEEFVDKREKRMARIVVDKKNRKPKGRRAVGSLQKGKGSPHWRAVDHGQAVAYFKKDFSKPGPAIPAGFNEITFNQLPLADRISQSRFFVRDVTLLSTRSDALVITGSSNVGRLMALLMGEKAKGRIRSLDTRWFPTAKFT